MKDSGNHVLNAVFIAISWITTIISNVTQDNITFILASVVSIAGIVNFFFAIRANYQKIKWYKKNRNGRKE